MAKWTNDPQYIGASDEFFPLELEGEGESMMAIYNVAKDHLYIHVIPTDLPLAKIAVFKKRLAEKLLEEI